MGHYVGKRLASKSRWEWLEKIVFFMCRCVSSLKSMPAWICSTIGHIREKLFKQLPHQSELLALYHLPHLNFAISLCIVAASIHLKHASESALFGG